MQHLLPFQDKLQHDEGAAAGGNFDLACGGGNGFGAVDLGIGVGLPEGAAGDFGHLNIVADEAGVDGAEHLGVFRMKRDELCHVVLSLLIVLIEPILQDFSALFNCAFQLRFPQNSQRVVENYGEFHYNGNMYVKQQILW